MIPTLLAVLGNSPVMGADSDRGIGGVTTLTNVKEEPQHTGIQGKRLRFSEAESFQNFGIRKEC